MSPLIYTTTANSSRHFSSPARPIMEGASTAPPAVAAAVPGFVSVASSSAMDAARRPTRPLKRSRKDQAAEAAGLSVGAQAGGLLRTTSTLPTLIYRPPPPPPPPPPLRVCLSVHPAG